MKLIKLMIVWQLVVLSCAVYANLKRDKISADADNPAAIAAESYLPSAERVFDQLWR